MALLRKRLSSQLTLLRTPFFPWRSPKPIVKKYEHRVWIGIGGNIGDVRRRFEHLFTFLNRQNDIRVLESSPILINPPFGYINQPDFYNATLLIATPLSPKTLLPRLQAVEKHFRRVRSFKDAPRTLDIDIIFYEDRVYSSSKLIIPHQGWTKRQSVLIPLKMMRRGFPKRWSW